MYGRLRHYWRFHRHRLWLFPEVGPGATDSRKVRERMGAAHAPMGRSGLQQAFRRARLC